MFPQPTASNHNNTFNNLGRIGYDITDNTQRNIQNKEYTDIVLSNYFSDMRTNSYVNFASDNRGIFYSGTSGVGINSNAVDIESQMFNRSEQERSYEKLQLFARPFATVPYLGRGSCDPNIESQLMQGEAVRGKKSATTIMEQYFTGQNTPLPPKTYEVESVALGEWGGMDTRTSGDKYFDKSSRPSDKSW